MCRESGTPIRLHANVVTAGTEVEKLQMSGDTLRRPAWLGEAR
jgi:hypothetical protein